ncbi:MAG: IS66 family transposase [Planctomycetota bacterium]|jgi:transposase
MEIDPKNLPTNVQDSWKIIIFQQKQISEQAEKIATISQQYANLQHQVLNLIRGKYGQQSEKYPVEYFAGDLFAKDAPAPKAEPEKEEITYKRTKRNGHRNIPKELPRVRIEYKLSEEDLDCPCGCGNKLHKIGEVITEQLEIVPAKIYVNQHVRFKYAGCADKDKVITAPMPAQPIDKGFAGPGLLADVIVNKYDDHMPLYRQSEKLARSGINISRKTLCDWVLQCAALLKPVVDEMAKDVLKSPKIHTDDTPVPVQFEGKTKEGRLWVYLGCGSQSPPAVVYDYTPNRQQQWAQEFLSKYQGYLQADAYQGYDKIYADNKVIEVACMAHARRKFVDIEKNANKTALSALNYIGKLYKIERRIKDFHPVAKRAIRKLEAKPILKEFKIWLKRKKLSVIPKSPMGKAVNYALKNWIALTRYLADGVLDIDNNAAERLIRPIAVGRKNWMFAGSDRGGRAAAIMYSLIETCKLNNKNPYDYLRDTLTRLPTTLQRDIAELLPYERKPVAKPEPINPQLP